jgi:hypothetical protein
MRQIFDNLLYLYLYLDYETGFDPVRRNLSYLNPLYFALPGQSSKEQFDYFAHLCVWLMQASSGARSRRRPSTTSRRPSWTISCPRCPGSDSS